MNTLNTIKLTTLAIFLLLAIFMKHSEARRSSGGSSHSSGGSMFSSGSRRRPSGADPNDPRYRTNNPYSFDGSNSDSDSDKKHKKKKKSFF